jgi:hypothetical protein
MRVIIEADVFRVAPALGHHGELLALVLLGKRGKKGHHTIEVDPRDSPAFRMWLDSEGKATRAVCEQILEHGKKDRSLYKKRTVRVADIQAPSWSDLRLPLQTALQLLRNPLRLLLENGRNDRNFLGVITRLAPNFDLQQLVKDGAVDIRAEGGIDENRKWLEKYGHAPEEACRLWVMCDSDARRPWREPSGKPFKERLGTGTRELAEVCDRHKIPLHILFRRAIENYLPLSLLHDWSARDRSEREKLCRAFAKLSAEQRHYYNLKKGFKKDEEDQEHAVKAGDLYRTLDPKIWETLEGGFDKNIAELFDERLGHIRQGWLLHDQQEDEACRIANAILEHL